MNLSSDQKKKIVITTKTFQIKTLVKPISTRATAASREPDNENLQEKLVLNLSSTPLTNAEKSLLQKGLKCAVPPKGHYITVTKHICDSLGENNLLEQQIVQNITPKLRISCQNL